MPNLSKTISKVSQSETIKISNLALKLKEQGKSIISLAEGEPDFDTPDVIKTHAIKAIESGKTKYTDVSGISELKKAVASKFKIENSLSYSEDEIIISTGGKQVLYNALASILNPGDEVLILKPFCVSYPEMVKLCGATPILIPTTNHYFDFPPIEILEKFTTKKTKCIIINTPNNPSGKVLGKEDLNTLKIFLTQNPDIWVISDEIYEHIIFDNTKHLSILNIEPNLRNRSVIINGVSKSYAMTGWRIGFGAGPKNIISSMKKIQSQTTSGPSSISQWAALAALSTSEDFINTNKKVFKERRDLIIKHLTKNDFFSVYPPSGAFYLLVNIERAINLKYQKTNLIETDFIFTELLLKNAGVAVVPGSAFGAPNHIRISFATQNENIIKACKKIISFVSSLE